jgi:serine/threonine-protein kinase
MQWLIIGFVTLIVMIIFQKIQKMKIKTTVKRNELYSNDSTEILNHENNNKVHINLPNKTVHVKRAFKDALFIGQIVFEKYKIVEVMHVGYMSHVYLVKHLILGSYWCLKIVTTYDNTGLFQEEGILKQMNYQMIPKMIDIFYEGNIVYIIEEYIEGISLKELLYKEGQFKEQELIQWGIELCEIFEYLHNHDYYPIIYRDLKPENIIVTHNRHLALIDFGLAKFKTSKKEDYMPSGTKLFAPKEQFKNNGMTDELTDLYSIGMVMAYLVLENDFKEDISLKNLSKFVSKDFSKVLLKAINEERHLRFESARQLRQALEGLLLKKYGFFS